MSTIESTQVIAGTSAAGGEPGAKGVALAPGDVLEAKYKLLSLLGQGGMGAVWDAENITIGRRVAIKVLQPQAAADVEIIARFIQEARAAAAVGNEHIIDVLDLGKLPDGVPYIVMERLEGQDLEALMNQLGPMPVARVARIALQICDALGAAHDKGIVHRDLKPPNIFLTRRGGDADFVKVLDFGISKVRGAGSLTPTAKTQTGITMGTPHYMSPEQAQGKKEADHRADLYSLGVILYNMFTGALPFPGDNVALILARILRDEPEAPSKHRADLPPYVDQLVLRLLEKDPDRRYATCAELAAALTPLAEQDDTIVSRRAWTPVPTLSDEPAVGPVSTQAAPVAGAETAAAVAAVKGSPKPLLWGGLVAVGVIAIAAVVLLGGKKEPGPAKPVAVVTPVDARPPVVVAPSVDAARAAPVVDAPVVAEVRVKLEAVPAEAIIYLGGVRFPNPLDAPRPRSLEPTRIVVEHPGYKPAEELVVLDRDVTRRIVLEPLRGVAPATGSGKKPPKEGPPATGSAKPPDDGVYRGNQGTIRDQWDDN